MTAMAALLLALRMAGPVAVPVETRHDFGEFWAGETLQHTFRIRNEGDAVLQLLIVKPSSGYSLAGLYDREVPPGALGKIPVFVNTKDWNGPFTKTVVVSTNDPDHPTLRLQISGVAWPRVAVDPPRAAFSQIQPDAVLSKLITITNNTDQWMELTLEKAESGPFTASLNEVIPGAQSDLLVECKPPYQIGMNLGTITLTHNIVDQPRIEVVPEFIILDAAPEHERAVTLRFLNHGPGEICVSDARADDPRLTATVAERTPGKAYEIALLLPAGYLPPEDGASLTITTSDVIMHTLRVPIIRAAPSQGDESIDPELAR